MTVPRPAPPLLFRTLPPIRPRDPHERHRVATPLELFFDLVFVVAIAQAAAGLHHAIADAHAWRGLTGYLLAFFALWWAWMSFTWFASAYDNDDALYRTLVFVQMCGALVVAAGVSSMLVAHAPNAAVVLGYVLMRVAAVTQWIRAALGEDAARCRTAWRSAVGVSVVQLAWVVTFYAGWLHGAAILPLIVAELAVPVWAARAGSTPWHPHHITERYGLLTLIVLGESVLAATVAVQQALAAGDGLGAYGPTIIGGLLTLFAMWWVYFDRPVHDLLTTRTRAFVWGYGHYVIYASAAAVGAGLAVNVDVIAGKAAIGVRDAGLAVGVPVAIFLMCLWWLHDRPEYRATRLIGPLAAGLVLLATWLPQPVLAIGLVLLAMLVVKRRRLRSVA